MMLDASRLELALVVCIDDRYAMPAAAMIRSACSNLREDHDVRLFIITPGISDSVKRKLASSLPSRVKHCSWVSVSRSDWRHYVPQCSYFSEATLTKLEIESSLPDELSKVLYLDCDMVVLSDLAELWSTPFKGATVLAVCNHGLPFTGLVGGYFAEFGLPPTTPCFNSGMMLIDLVAWRRDRISARIQDVLHSLPTKPRFADQCIFNIALYGKVGFVHPKWNYWDRLKMFAYNAVGPNGIHEVREALQSPAIVHFAMKSKPWHSENSHEFRDAFFMQLESTSWRSWRPEPPSPYMTAINEIELKRLHAFVAVKRFIAMWRCSILTLAQSLAYSARILTLSFLKEPATILAPFHLLALRALARGLGPGPR